MADLKCSAISCVYNKDNLCAKGDIMVGGKHACQDKETSCESFAPKKEGKDSYVSALDHPSHTISIDCEAEKCKYNKSYKCVAEHVDIMGGNACSSPETMCGTFTEK